MITCGNYTLVWSREDPQRRSSSRKALADALVARIETPESLLARLDAKDNELEVRAGLAAGRYNSRNSALAEEWLRRKEDRAKLLPMSALKHGKLKV